MKYLFFLFFSLVYLNISAQSQVVLDTTYNTSKSGFLYTINLVQYADGSYTERATIQGDSISILNDQVQKIETRCNMIAEAAVIAMQARQASIDFAKMDTLCISLTARSPVKQLMDAYSAELSIGQWVIIINGTTTNVTFPVLSTNQRKRLLPAGSTAKTMLIFGKMMRLINYPATGINLLFRVKEGLWQSIDKSVILKKI